MATTKLYLDIRSPRKDGTGVLKLAINHKQNTALLNLDIRLLPNQWDNVTAKIVNHPQKQYLNNLITRRRAEVETEILRLSDSGRMPKMTAQSIKKYVESSNSSDTSSATQTFEGGFLAFIDSKTGSTKGLYEYTLKRLRDYCTGLSELSYTDITPEWLKKFDGYLARTAPSKNYRNIHLRNIRAVFNAAIDSEYTDYYPFRKFKIRPVATRKRSLSIDDLRRLFDFTVEPYAELYRDMFKLIFMLIGINSVDLHRLKSITADGRIEYTRAKTHRLYSIKVEP